MPLKTAFKERVNNINNKYIKDYNSNIRKINPFNFTYIASEVYW